MCGIVGFFNSPITDASEVLNSMMCALSHRGPDSWGSWKDQDSRLFFGHRRLSILDLSPGGHQPMVSHSGRFVICFNGEIYNHEELRQELIGKGSVFHSSSDTEVMLEAFETWGIQGSLSRFVGMFSFALYDQKEALLTLGRDRLGEKPLYFGWQNKTFLFASELKALHSHPDFLAELNKDARELFFTYGYIPGPHSIYSAIYKLLPGCYLTIPTRNNLNMESFSPFPEDSEATHKCVRYWSVQSHFPDSSTHVYLSDEESVETLEHLLVRAVKLQMHADVPVGCFLSGGIDSSMVAALFQKHATHKVRTFAIGFEEDKYNEAKFARGIADYLGTDHHEEYVSARDAQNILPNLPEWFDEPFSDSSQIPTYAVARLARRHVTVSVSGDGGDEICAGYPRYWLTKRIWDFLRYFPMFARTPLSRGIRLISPVQWDLAYERIKLFLPQYMRLNRFGDKVHKLAAMMDLRSFEELYISLIRFWNSNGVSAVGAIPQLPGQGWSSTLGAPQTAILWDILTYLPDDILVKVDRATMAVSLESRAPLLDHRVVEFMLSLPIQYKMREGKTKWIFRRLLSKYIPSELYERPKMGFGIPLDSWLRGPLKDWAHTMIHDRSFEDLDSLYVQDIRRKWQEHLLGKHSWEHHLWTAISYQAWAMHIKKLAGANKLARLPAMATLYR